MTTPDTDKPPFTTLDFELKVPPDDELERLVCNRCGWVHYANPRIVVGAVVQWGDRFLLCRRKIEPRSGFWTIPAGYMEEKETAPDGAAREAWEEARARIEIDNLLAVYSITRLSQVQLVYRAKLTSEDIGPGPESLEVALFAWEDIPWNELAFPTVHWALNHFKETEGQSSFSPFSNPLGETGQMGPPAATKGDEDA